MAILDECFDRGRLDAHRGEAVITGKMQFKGFTRCQGDGPHLGDDYALVAHLGREQGDVAFQAGLKFTLVNDATRGSITAELVFAGHEVVDADRMGRGHESADVDASARGEVDPVRIGKEHLAIGV